MRLDAELARLGSDSRYSLQTEGVPAGHPFCLERVMVARNRYKPQESNEIKDSKNAA